MQAVATLVGIWRRGVAVREATCESCQGVARRASDGSDDDGPHCHP